MGNCPNVAIDPFGLDWLDDASNYTAGIADSLSFGLSRQARKGLNWLVFNTYDDGIVDPSSTMYIAGEATEVVVEIFVTAGGATLRHAAAKTTRYAVEGGARTAFRRANMVVGGIVHHANPIKGHPGGSLARYPLPFKWAAQGFWNMQHVSESVHLAKHARMMRLESLDRLREMTLITRQAVNRLQLYFEKHGSCFSWSEIDVKTTVAGDSGPPMPEWSNYIKVELIRSESGISSGN